MKFGLHFIPEVEEDLVSAYSWYEAKSAGLGEEFLRIFYACANELLREPLLYAKIHKEIRRRLLRRFPYAIYFTIKDKQIVVLGLFHCARDPRTIKLKLRYRRKTRR